MGIGEASPYGKLHHVGVVVRDIDRAIGYFESIGLGPFERTEGKKWLEIEFKGELHGKPGAWKVKIGNAQMGESQLELLQPSGGQSALQESLDATGEGLHHVGYLVEDLDVEVRRAVGKGLRVWTISRRLNEPSFVYFEPTEVGAVAIELRTR